MNYHREQTPPLFAREAEVAAAKRNTEAIDYGWNARAKAFAVQYAATHADFTGEELTRAGEAVVGKPTHGAWGAVLRELAAAGQIRQTGDYRKRENGNATPVWKKL